MESLLRRLVGGTKTETCKVINGLATEAADTIKDVTDPVVRDIALIGAAQQVEHHEIAVSGTLRHWAEPLGLEDDAVVLETIKSDEVNADEILTNLSERAFEKMLDHPNIHVMLNTDYGSIKEQVSFRELIFTGQVDEYFDYCYGKLTYARPTY